MSLVNARELWNWLAYGEPIRKREAEQDGLSIPSREVSDRSVSVREAYTLPSVYRAIQILATSGKQLSIDTTRYGIQIDDHPLTRRPDPFISRSKWIEQSIVSLASSGNLYHEKVFESPGDPRTDVVSMPVLNPLDVQIKLNDAGRVSGYQYRGRELKAYQVQHSTLLPIPGTPYGLGPIQAAQADLRGVLDTRDYAANWFDSGAQPNGVLKSAQILTQEAATIAADRFNDTVGARRGVLVLGQGLDYSPVFLSPKDVQFIEAQQFNVTTVARMFGIPASLMLAAVEGTAQTYTNIEQVWIEYVRFTLMDYLVEIEEALSSVLPGRQTARFNVEALLRTDTAARYAAHQTAITIGLYDAAYAAAIESIPAAAVPTKEAQNV